MHSICAVHLIIYTFSASSCRGQKGPHIHSYSRFTLFTLSNGSANGVSDGG